MNIGIENFYQVVTVHRQLQTHGELGIAPYKSNTGNSVISF